MLARIWRKGNPLTLLVGMQAGTATLENSMDCFPQDIKNRATQWYCNCTTGYLPQRYRCSEKKGHMHPSAHSNDVHNSQTVEGAKMPFNGWVDREDVVHTYSGILLNHQKGWIPIICINMDGTGRDYVKWNKSSREKQLYGFNHMWNIRNSVEDHRGREGKLNGKKLERETSHERPWILENKLRVSE